MEHVSKGFFCTTKKVRRYSPFANNEPAIKDNPGYFFKRSLGGELNGQDISRNFFKGFSYRLDNCIAIGSK